MLCATSADLDKLRIYVDKLATKQELGVVRNEVLPVIGQYRVEMDKFRDSHQQMKEMIRRFDEVLSEKASKVALIELEKEIDL